MRFFTVLVVSFYTILFLLIGGMLIAYALHLINLEALMIFLQNSYNILNMRVALVVSGGFIIIISLFLAQVILGNLEKERTIAFTTNLGQGSVSLSAIENLIKRISMQLYEIKDIRPDVVATKKGGLEVSLRVTLRFETNIQDFTNRLQELVKNKLQEILGIEENIVITTHIAKIISLEEKQKEKEASTETPVPFQGYARA